MASPQRHKAQASLADLVNYWHEPHFSDLKCGYQELTRVGRHDRRQQPRVAESPTCGDGDGLGDRRNSNVMGYCSSIFNVVDRPRGAAARRL